MHPQLVRDLICEVQNPSLTLCRHLPTYRKYVIPAEGAESIADRVSLSVHLQDVRDPT